MLEYGILPLFNCCVPGLSASEMTPGGLWFSDVDDEGLGLWGWKAPVIRGRKCAYGQFFAGKKGFVSLDLLPDFINWRCHRWGTKDENKTAMEEIVLEVLGVAGQMTKAEIRTAMGYGYKRQSAADPVDLRAEKKLPLDPILSGLQKQGRVIISDITPRINRLGDEDKYGWQVAHFARPEDIFGRENLRAERTAEESKEKITDHLSSILPGVDRQLIEKLI